MHQDPFQDVLHAMSSEALLRLRHRLEVTKKKEIAAMITEELKKRGNEENNPEVSTALLQNARDNHKKKTKK
jgi:hypothetical protein